MRKYFFFLIFSLLIFTSHTLILRHGIYGDGNGYYSYAQAILFDGGLNFGPIYNHLSNFEGREGTFNRLSWEPVVGPKGVMFNPYLVGTGIIWLPSLIITSFVNFVFGLGINRFDLVYEFGPGVSGILFMLGGLYFLEKYLRNFFSKRVSALTVTLTFLGSYILYYSAFEPALSHQPSFLLISFLLFWTYKFKGSALNFLVLGLISGFLLITRPADIILLIAVGWQVYRHKPMLKNTLFAIPGFLVGISPQVYVQYAMFGNVFINPYFSGQNGVGWQISLGHILAHLFSPTRGLFFWSPIFFIGVWGLLKQKLWVFLIPLFILWFTGGSTLAYQAAGFGQRFSVEATPYLALGLAYFYSKVRSPKAIFYSMPFVAWNIILLFGFYVLRWTR